MEVFMRAINIKLSHHDAENDWSIEIDGRMHEHVSTTTVDELVEYAIVAAQQSLLEAQSSSPFHCHPGDRRREPQRRVPIP
jgi:hypothetical protein